MKISLDTQRFTTLILSAVLVSFMAIISTLVISAQTFAVADIAIPNAQITEPLPGITAPNAPITEPVVPTPTPPPITPAPEPVVDTSNNPDSTLSLTIGSWNMYKYGDAAKKTNGIQTLIKDVDILGLQEAKDYNAAIRAAVSATSDVYPILNKEPLKIAMVWNKEKFRALDKGFFNGGYQPLYKLQRQFVWIKFRENTSGKVFYVINTHFPHNAKVKRGKLLYYTEDSNGKAWQSHMTKLVEKITELQKENLPIFVTGDINFNYRTGNCVQPLTPCKALAGDLQVKSGWEYTHLAGIPKSLGTIDGSSGLLDYVLSWQQPSISYQSMRILYGATSTRWNGSDHKPIGLSLTIGQR